MADNLRRYKSLYSSTASSFGTGTGVTITPSSIVGLPTTTELTLTFDRVNSAGTATPSLLERIIGSISGSNFAVRTSPATGRGADSTTEQAHTSPVVEMVWNAKDWNDLVDWAITEHNQDGTHKNTIVDLLAVAQTFTAIKTFTTGLLKAADIIDTVSALKVIVFTGVASAVNYLKVTNSATGNAVIVAPDGTDSNIDIKVGGKGVGKFVRTSAVNDTIYDNGNSGSAITINWANGSTQKLTLTGNCTLSYSNVKEGDYLNLILIQDGTGSRTVTWPSGTKHPNATAPTLTTTASAIDWIGIRAYSVSLFHVVASSLKLS